MDKCDQKPNITIGYSKTVLLWMLNEAKAEINIPAIYFSGVILLLGLIGNGLVVYAYGIKFKRTTANIFIFWLAVFDLVCCVISIPHEMMTLRFPMFYEYDVCCRTFRVLSVLAYTCESFMLICIGIDRFYKVCQPLKIISSRNPYYQILVTVAVAVSTSWSSAVVYGEMKVPTCIPGLIGSTCSISDKIKDTVFPGLYYGFQAVVFIISVTIIVILYCKICKTIIHWKRESFYPESNRISTIYSSQHTETEFSRTIEDVKQTNIRKFKCIANRGFYCIDMNRKIRRKNSFNSFINKDTNSSESSDYVTRSVFRDRAQTSKTTVILLVVSVTFIFSYLPYLTGEILIKTEVITLGNLSSVSRKMMEIVAKSYCINNAANPFIYGLTNPQFRKVIVELFRHKRLNGIK